MKPSAQLRPFVRRLDVLVKNLVKDVASRGAPEATRLLRASFDAGENAYGKPWRPSTRGGPVDLVETGRLRDELKFKTTLTGFQVIVQAPYAVYQLAARRKFIPGNRRIPPKYSASLTQIVKVYLKQKLERP